MNWTILAVFLGDFWIINACKFEKQLAFEQLFADVFSDFESIVDGFDPLDWEQEGSCEFGHGQVGSSRDFSHRLEHVAVPSDLDQSDMARSVVSVSYVRVNMSVNRYIFCQTLY